VQDKNAILVHLKFFAYNALHHLEASLFFQIENIRGFVLILPLFASSPLA